MIATIANGDVTPYLIDFTKETSACRIGGSGTFLLSSNYPINVLPGWQCYFSEAGCVFSGWVTSVEKPYPKTIIKIEANDCQPLVDYFFTEPYIIGADTDVGDVADAILALVGMTGNPSPHTGFNIPAGYDFVYQKGPEAMSHLLAQCGDYYLESDGNWCANFKSLSTNPHHDLEQIINFKTYRSTDWIRNQVIVVGAAIGGSGVPIYSSGTLPSPNLDPWGHIQRLIIQNGMINTQLTADTVVTTMLRFYSRLLHTKNYICLGTEALNLADWAHGLDFQGRVTSYRQSFGRGSIVQELELDGRCQSIWGWGSVELHSGIFEIVDANDNAVSATVG